MQHTFDGRMALLNQGEWRRMTLAADFSIISGGEEFLGAAEPGGPGRLPDGGCGQLQGTGCVQDLPDSLPTPGSVAAPRVSLPSTGSTAARPECLRSAGSAAARLDQLLDEESARRLALLAGAEPGAGDGATFHRKDGSPWELVLVSLGDGFSVLYRDLSTRRDALERLALFYRHFHSTPTGICITDPEGAIQEANRSFLDLYGYRAEEVLGQNPRLLKSGRQAPDAYREMWANISDPSRANWSGEIINRKKSGEEVEVLLTISAVHDGAGQHMGYIASTVDLTSRRLLERELLAQNQDLLELNRLKSDLMAITSHDLKSPLSAIVSRARMLRELAGELSADKRGEQIDKIIDAGLKMASFIDELLDLDRMEAGRYRLESGRLHLDTLLASCVETNLPAAGRRGIEIALTVQGTPAPLRGEQIKLEQLFNNIISNAVKFSPDGATIRVSYRDRPGEPKLVTVDDEGPGIPEQDLAHIFDRYFQVRREGSVPRRIHGAGLGLSIVKHIAELHGGTVSAANRPEGGCSFRVTLPARVPARSGRDLAALIIDPFQDISGSLQGLLCRREVSCYFAKNYQEVCRIQQRERPDLILAASGALNDDLIGYLASRAEGVLRVGIGAWEPGARHSPFDCLLVPPVLDLELYQLLEALLSAEGVTGG
jgi:PAS domain S-box-containing protein